MNIKPALEQLIDGIMWPAMGSNEQNFVTRKLKLSLDHENYIVLGDINLPSNGNTTVTQIDQIVVSIYGIFCIETKSTHGWVFGSLRGTRWTQRLGLKNYHMDNPFFQNYCHVKAIELALKDFDLKKPIESMIALPEAGNILVNDTDNVGDAHQIIDKIKSHSAVLYTHEECDNMKQQLNFANITNPSVLKNHKNEISALRRVSAQKVAQLMHF